MKKKLGLIKVIIAAVLIIFVLLIGTIVFFTNQVKKVTEEDEDLYFNHLYSISEKLINADRDLYQALVGSIEYYDMKDGIEGIEPELLATILESNLNDYYENVEQTYDRFNEAVAIASEESTLYTGTTLDGETMTFKDYANQFSKNLKSWQALYDVKSSTGDYSEFVSFFSTVRGDLSNMTDITEKWAIETKSAHTAQIQRSLLVIIIVMVVVLIIVMIVATFILRVIITSVKEMTTSIEKVAAGDFATAIPDSSAFTEFSDIEAQLEKMRKRLQTSLKEVIDCSENISSMAQSTKEKLDASKNSSSNISSAMNELALGATTMAEDIQTASVITGDMGNSIDVVQGAAETTLTNVNALYTESSKLQQQLNDIREADKKTDERAGQVAESVGKTAEVVGEISSVAENIIAIASQTNLLALNASIEAARAGEAGRGFSVVAENIKSLAEQTNQLAGEITGMLGTITQYSNENKSLTTSIKEATTNEAQALQRMSESFDEMLAMLKDTEGGNKQIASLVEQMTSGKEQILSSMESLASISEENAASTEETSASLIQMNDHMTSISEDAEALEEISGQLKKNVAFFTV